MAIDKERLDALAKEGKTIYGIGVGRILEKEIVKIDTKDVNYSYSNDNFQYVDKDKVYLYEFYEEDLFEEEDDARFALEFKDIIRQNRLDLPTFNEFDSEFSFKSAKGRIITMFQKGDVIIIESDYERFFTKPYTKAFYNLACCYCRELFLYGEIRDANEILRLRQKVD